jgi:two-component system, LytTR family, sensor kinase
VIVLQGPPIGGLVVFTTSRRIFFRSSENRFLYGQAWRVLGYYLPLKTNFMSFLKKMLPFILISYVIVLGVNIAGNYAYYAAGNDWHYSVYYVLGMTTFCWLFFTVMGVFVFSRMSWADRPTLRILLGSLIFAASGAFVTIVATKGMNWILHFDDLPIYEYINRSVSAAMFSMIIGLMITGQRALSRVKTSVAEIEVMKREMIQSQFETLKSQVNPHFLFNSLNTLTVMIPKQPDVAVRFVEQMSKVFRYSLQHREDNTIDVGTELKVVQSYLFLNEQRYDGKLRVTITVDEVSRNKKIITQSLLMLTENAIKHNELSNENPLSIRIYNEGVYLVAENSLQRKTLIEKSTNVGLDNIQKRYALATETPVVIEEKNNLFIVKIPLLDQ